MTGYFTDSSFRELIHKDSNREIMAVDRETAFQAFMDWLDETFGESVLLVAHNCFNFDAKVYIIVFLTFKKKLNLVTMPRL